MQRTSDPRCEFEHGARRRSLGNPRLGILPCVVGVVNPAGRGKRFDPEKVDIVWRNLSGMRWSGVVESDEAPAEALREAAG